MYLVYSTVMKENPGRGKEGGEREIPEGVGSDGDDSLGTLLGGEAGGIVEDVVGEGSEVEPGLVGVGEPGSAGDCQHALRAMHPHSE